MVKEEKIDKWTTRRTYNIGGKEYREYETRHEDGHYSYEIYTDSGKKVGWAEQDKWRESAREAKERAWDRAMGRRKD
jgi:hypothetical protein